MVPEPKSVENPADAAKSAAVAQSVRAASSTRAIQERPGQTGSWPCTDSAKVEEPAPGAWDRRTSPRSAPAVSPRPHRPRSETGRHGQACRRKTAAQLEPPPPNPAAQGRASLRRRPRGTGAAAALLDLTRPFPIPGHKPPNRNLPRPTRKTRARQPGLTDRTPSRGPGTARLERYTRPARNECARRHENWRAKAGCRFPNSGKIVFDDPPDADAHRDDTGSELAAAGRPRHATSAAIPPRTSISSPNHPEPRRPPNQSKTAVGPSSVQAPAPIPLNDGRRPSRAHAPRGRAQRELLDDLAALLQLGPVLSGLVEGKCRQISENR